MKKLLILAVISVISLFAVMYYPAAKIGINQDIKIDSTKSARKDLSSDKLMMSKSINKSVNEQPAAQTYPSQPQVIYVKSDDDWKGTTMFIIGLAQSAIAIFVGIIEIIKRKK